jgi:hypothetical protein
MTHPVTRFALILSLLVPAEALARGQQPETNVNTRYQVESVSIAGVPEATFGTALRDDMQKLVGAKYDPEAAEALADRMRRQLHDYRITIKVKRGESPEHVKVTFQAERVRNAVSLAPFLSYYTHDGFSGALPLSLETHHNYFSFGVVSSADELLERYAGIRVRYEHRKVGTGAVQIGLEYDRYHQSFEPETTVALLTAPEVSGVYRTREDFAPSVSVFPIPDLRVTVGASLQTLNFEFPTRHAEAAYAFTADVHFRRLVRADRGFRHTISADYGVRDATPTLESDFVYTRQLVAADYMLTVGRQSFGFHVKGGHISGRAPLFERFSLGNTMALRGWNKFDVAPLGGSRLAYGSLEYRYRPFLVFYDVGAVWDPEQPTALKHSVGFGLALKNGFFLSVGFPVRLHSVTPAFMFGFRG